MPSDASVQVACRTSYFKTEQSTPHRSAVLGSSLMLNSVLGWSGLLARRFLWSCCLRLNSLRRRLRLVGCACVCIVVDVDDAGRLVALKDHLLMISVQHVAVLFLRICDSSLCKAACWQKMPPSYRRNQQGS